MKPSPQDRLYEFHVLMERARKCGKTPAELAREIGVTDAAISQWNASKSPPKTPTLVAIRQAVERWESPNVVINPPATQEDIYSQLNDLARYDPSSYEAAKLTIGAFHSKIVRTEPLPKPESVPVEPPKPDSAAKRLLKRSIKPSKPS